LIGIASYSVLITIGIILLSGVPLPRWILGGIVLGSGVSTIFVSWLAYQSIFVIGALCAYCIVAWGMTLPIFSLSARDLMRSSERPILKSLSGLMGLFLVAWSAAVFILIYLFLII